jgi:hypothetical protein
MRTLALILAVAAVAALWTTRGDAWLVQVPAGGAPPSCNTVGVNFTASATGGTFNFTASATGGAFNFTCN